MICPVCNEEMIITDNPQIFKCKKQNIWCPNIKNISGPKIQAHLDITHAVIFTDDTKTISTFDMPPYIITIYDTGAKTAQTVIKEYISSQPFVGDNIQISDQEILRLDSVVSLPWHDPIQVIERIKTYLLFS